MSLGYQRAASERLRALHRTFALTLPQRGFCTVVAAVAIVAAFSRWPSIRPLLFLPGALTIGYAWITAKEAVTGRPMKDVEIEAPDPARNIEL
jgi:hypothetical protein